MTILIALATLGGLTLALAGLLIIANRKLYVYEDPRIEIVEDMLPKANCGACGYPGCRPFAEALVGGEVLPGKCTVSSEDGRAAIADYLGVALGGEDKKVARLACAGGSHVARQRAEYRGLPSCQAAALVSGGGKGCFWGCLGHGDCAVVCDFDAIHLDEHGLPVVDVEKCTACGDCVEACPKGLFSIEPMRNRLWVACKNEMAGDGILDECQVACTACGKCAVDAPAGMIEMAFNLPIIHHGVAPETTAPIERCASGAIVWLEDDGSARRGRESRKIIRKGARPVGDT